MKKIRFENVLLRSRVARRIFFLFVVCAFVPICFFGFISVHQVTSEFNQKAQIHLYQTSKITGLSIYTRLLMLENELSSYAQHYSLKKKIIKRKLYGTSSQNPFTNVILIDRHDEINSLFGSSFSLPTLNKKQQKHLQKAMSIMITQSNPAQNEVSLFIIQLFNQGEIDQGIIYGQINPNFLWGINGEDILPSENEELIILDSSRNVLFTTFSRIPTVHVLKKIIDSLSTPEQFNWKHNDIKYLSAYWQIFLEYHFSAGQWIVITGQTLKQILTPIEHSKKIFTLLIALTLCIVTLLSISMIRKNLIPIEKLKEMTKKITGGDFSHSVTIKSGDEFEELGDSFNNMARELNRQQKSLQISEKKSKNLAARLLDTQENERKNISKELHDDLGQLLTAVLLDIGSVMDTKEGKQENLKHALGRIHLGTFETLRKIRNISAALRPGVLDYLGLEAAAKSLLDEFNERSEINFTGNLDIGNSKISDATGIALYRILQETITNIIKHAKADEVFVTLAANKKKITLSIKDNGQGFNPEELPVDKGIGLLGMKERIDALNGSFRLESSPGKGTKINACCPL